MSSTRSSLIREAGSAILFLGILSSNLSLQHEAQRALSELAQAGYAIPTADKPITVALTPTAGEFSTKHAGGWRPNFIYLRDPGSDSQPDDKSLAQRLRHELMHEATQRTCRDSYPRWAAESAAIAFSGEIDHYLSFPPNADIQHLNDQLNKDAPLNSKSYLALVSLVSHLGWDAKPCAIEREYLQFFASGRD